MWKEIKENWDSLSGPKQLVIFVVVTNVFLVTMCWVLSPLWR